jgi:glycosyltransferase involved in cell wall biosynthesis
MRLIHESVPDTLLLIAGSTKEKDAEQYLAELKREYKRLSLENHIRFDTRYIPSNEISVYFSAASIILVPYTESVGASAVIHNYAGYGIPIIASDTGYHMREILGHNILLFKAGDPHDLADKLTMVLTNEELAQKVGNNIAAFAQSEGWEVGAKRTLQHYRYTLSL